MTNEELEKTLSRLYEDVASVQVSFPVIIDTLIYLLDEKGLIDPKEFQQKLDENFKDVLEASKQEMEKEMDKESAQEEIKKIQTGEIPIN